MNIAVSGRADSFFLLLDQSSTLFTNDDKEDYHAIAIMPSDDLPIR
jgi:hypothetical protein